MIWFACKQCGKKHGRPESSSGTLVFCECGHGNLVPWESTTAEPEALPAAPVPVPPRLEPVPVGEERQPPPLPRPARREVPFDDERRPPERLPQRRRQRRRERDPNYCFNHEHLAAEETCAACKERFCRHCVIAFDGRTLCGPCKNEQIRALTRSPRVSGMAVTAVLLALVAGVLPIFLMMVSTSAGAVPVVLLALLPQLAAFALGGLALHTTEANAKLSGRPLALTAMVTAGVGAILTVGITLYSYVQWV